MRFAMAVLLALAAGCQKPTCEVTGEVVGHHYEPGSVIMMPMHVDKTTIMLPQTLPDEYYLAIRDANGVQHWANVDEASYRRFPVGASVRAAVPCK